MKKTKIINTNETPSEDQPPEESPKPAKERFQLIKNENFSPPKPYKPARRISKSDLPPAA